MEPSRLSRSSWGLTQLFPITPSRPALAPSPCVELMELPKPAARLLPLFESYLAAGEALAAALCMVRSGSMCRALSQLEMGLHSGLIQSKRVRQSM